MTLVVGRLPSSRHVRSASGGVHLLLWRRLYDLASTPAERASIREQLVGHYLPLAEQLARRYGNRGEPLDDLVQVARLGLLKAVDGFDPDRGVAFVCYATPTISGELKRHFRDKGWTLRVPRRLKDLRLDINRALPRLSQDLGRTATVADLAAHLAVSPEAVHEAMSSSRAYRAMSLSTPLGHESSFDEATLGDTLGASDEGMEGVEDREMLRPLLQRLAPRERRIVGMRFFENLTQSEIAAHVGISQMHVSRLLTRSLEQMRANDP